MSEMVERVAKAMIGEENWPFCTGLQREVAFLRARLAIAAMREPTEAMRMAGLAALRHWSAIVDNDTILKHIYMAMIAAELQP